LITHLQRLRGTAQIAEDETVEWWELRDPGGALIYRQTYSVALTESGFQNTVAVGAEPLLTKLGEGVLVEGGELPSANGGSWVQVFGTKYGPGPTKITGLTPFGPPMSTDGELIDVAIDPRRSTPQSPGRTVVVMNDILRFRVWTGNVSIVYPVLINWIAAESSPRGDVFGRQPGDRSSGAPIPSWWIRAAKMS